MPKRDTELKILKELKKNQKSIGALNKRYGGRYDSRTLKIMKANGLIRQTKANFYKITPFGKESLSRGRKPFFVVVAGTRMDSGKKWKRDEVTVPMTKKECAKSVRDLQRVNRRAEYDYQRFRNPRMKKVDYDAYWRGRGTIDEPQASKERKARRK